mgnify:CR=1 FL=1
MDLLPFGENTIYILLFLFLVFPLMKYNIYKREKKERE